MKKIACLLAVAAVTVTLASNSTFSVSQAQSGDHGCWGQASAVFAQMGMMGEHSRSQGNPRVGLRNLARDLYDLGVIADDTMDALGAFVAAELGLSIDACM